MDSQVRSLIAGLLLGGSHAVGGAALVTAAFYGLTCMVARFDWITVPKVRAAQPDATLESRLSL